MFTVDIVQSSVNSQNFDTFLSWNPFFVSLVYRLDVLQTDVFLTFSVANLDALKTYFRWTFQIDDSLDGAMLNKWVADWIVNLVFVRLKIAVLLHDFPKNVSISQWWTFRKQQLILFFLYWLFPKQSARVQSIQLKCKPPSFGIIIVLFQYVDSTDIFPQINWFLDSLDVQET